MTSIPENPSDPKRNKTNITPDDDSTNTSLPFVKLHNTVPPPKIDDPLKDEIEVFPLQDRGTISQTRNIKPGENESFFEKLPWDKGILPNGGTPKSREIDSLLAAFNADSSNYDAVPNTQYSLPEQKENISELAELSENNNQNTLNSKRNDSEENKNENPSGCNSDIPTAPPSTGQTTNPVSVCQDENDQSKTVLTQSIFQSFPLAIGTNGTNPPIVLSSSGKAKLLTIEPTASESGAPQNIQQDPTVLSSVPPIEIVLPDSPANKAKTGSSIATLIAQASDQDANDSVASPMAESTIEYNSAGQLPIGTKLGHFQITAYIGGGGMGNVYEGIDKALDRKVAIKVLSPERAGESASVARFLNEARSAARLNHEHIAQVYYCGEERRIPFIAFEYVEGTNVRAYIMEHGRFALPQALDFILQIAGALEHASRHGVTHRDVKPSNIIITPQGNAKLIDMGLARLLRASDAKLDLTASGITLGTFDYISPEQARDPRNADVRSDIYSLGCTFFYMLTGQPPFAEGTVLQKLLKHQGDEPPRVRAFVPDIPQEIDDVILKMMAKNPKNRFQTPAILKDCLLTIAENIGLRPYAGTDDWSQTDSRVRRLLLLHLPWTISLVLLLFFVFLVRHFTTQEAENILPQTPLNLENPTPFTLPLPELGNNNFLNGESDSNKTKSPATKIMHLGNVRIYNEKNLDRIYNARRTGTLDLRENNSFSLDPPWRSAAGLGPEAFDATSDFNKWREKNADRAATQKLALFWGEEDPRNLFVWSRGKNRITNEPGNTIVNSTATESNRDTLRLIVDNTGEKKGCYQSIQEALNEAEKLADPNVSNQEILLELQFNGSTSVSSIALAGKKIRFTAADGFKPQIQFNPSGAKNSPDERFFLLDATDLTLENIAVDLILPSQNNNVPEWTVFEFREGSSVYLRNTAVTINNNKGIKEKENDKNRLQVAFFRVNPEKPVTTRTETAAGRSFFIRLENSYFRGEGDLLFCRRTCRGKMEIDATLINIAGPLVRYDEETRLDTNDDRLSLVMNNSAGIFHNHLIVHEQKEGQNPLFPIQGTFSNVLIKLPNLPLLGSFSTFPKAELQNVSNWTIEQTILLNITGNRRHREYRTPNSFMDEPLANRPVLTLENYSQDADFKIKSTVPHLFTKDLFDSLLFDSLENGSTSEGDRNIIRRIRESVFQPVSAGFLYRPPESYNYGEGSNFSK